MLWCALAVCVLRTPKHPLHGIRHDRGPKSGAFSDRGNMWQQEATGLFVINKHLTHHIRHDDDAVTSQISVSLLFDCFRAPALFKLTMNGCTYIETRTHPHPDILRGSARAPQVPQCGALPISCTVFCFHMLSFVFGLSRSLSF